METTLVKADDKGRVSIRGARKGAKYLVTAENGGWWVMPAPKITVLEKVESFAGAWGLRAATLESFHGRSKSLSENSKGRCFRAKGWMARRDEREYPSWVFD